MKIGFIGLGKMGAGLVAQLTEKGHEVLAWNRSEHPLKNVASVEEMVKGLVAGERIIWLMLPAGKIVDEFLQLLKPMLTKCDLVIDGGNSRYSDTLRRAKELEELGISYMDVGVSGGPKGAREGACLMIGGDRATYDRLKPIWEAMAAPGAYGLMGSVGAGHFAKMVHNGIEYGMMQAIAEGAAVLKKSEFKIDMAKVFEIYNNRSVIESRLVGWTQEALIEDPELTNTSSKIDHTGEGEWTIEAAKELGVEVPIIEESLEVRKRSSEASEDYRDKVVSAMRGKFGGHAVKKAR
ncbi:MAG: decarboxylating 6-phosphogluconate dehydrogenase [Candidatus Moraniibacteriota bacterium]|nr:MAG: decarboxylating 6-phosphogluconate dehydrogenase [Candidatus Moranbacteria bacterium]